jgi:hypothetical protein
MAEHLETQPLAIRRTPSFDSHYAQQPSANDPRQIRPATNSSPNVIDDLPVLEEAEWNFDEKAVPDKEVRACLIWECARESSYLEFARWAAELRSKAEPSYWDSTTGKRKENSLAERRKAKREFKELAFDLEAHWHRLYRCHEAFNDFYSDVIEYARPWSRPWRLFPSDVRNSAVNKLTNPGIFPPLQPATLSELESLWSDNGKEVIEIRTGTVKPRFNDTLEMLGYDGSHPIEIPNDPNDPETKELTAAFTINFSLYTNREIVNAFSKWIAESRPCSEPVRRGKKVNDDRAALEGIGIMRAFHWYPFSHPLFPEKLRRKGRRACDKARKRALRCFQELLPFVPADSLPTSWRKAVRGSKSR